MLETAAPFIFGKGDSLSWDLTAVTIKTHRPVREASESTAVLPQDRLIPPAILLPLGLLILSFDGFVNPLGSRSG